MKIARALFIALVLVNLVACASTPVMKPRTDEKRVLRDQANEFYNAWRDKNSEKMWKLTSPFLRGESKEKWRQYSDLLNNSVDFLNYSNLTVIYLGKKLAVTQADVSMTLEQENFDTCERVIWLRFPEGWRFQEPGLICTYMPDKNRIKFLTKNVPDR